MCSCCSSFHIQTTLEISPTVQLYFSSQKFKKFFKKRWTFNLRKKSTWNFLGITYISIPFWWDLRLDTLKATLYHNSPEIFNFNPPVKNFQSLIIPSAQPSVIKNSNILSLVGRSWNSKDDPTGWWMSTSRRGIRAFWDGTCFRGIYGNKKLVTPEWFSAGLPRNVMFEGRIT